MHTAKKISIITISLISLINIAITSADVTDDAKAIKISGGEHYALILTNSKNVFGCGNNGFYQLGIDVSRYNLIDYKSLQFFNLLYIFSFEC